MLQVLYERGMIDTTIVTKPSTMKYSRDDKSQVSNLRSDRDENDEEKYSLSHLLSKCSDFKSEKKDLEYLYNELNVYMNNDCRILYTPKFHCKLAGEGIEYSWGASKRYYRRQPLSMKKHSGHFKETVSKSIQMVTVDMYRKFLRKARRYMVTYLHKRRAVRDGDANTWNFEENERIQRVYKCHRDANGFDGRFIESVMNKSINL